MVTNNNNKDIKDQIQKAATQLSTLLQQTNADPVYVEQILSQIRSSSLPKPTPDESLAHQRVEDALAAQRTVALLRTEARLHENAASRCHTIMRRLQSAERRIMMMSSENIGEGQEVEEDDLIDDPTNFNAPFVRTYNNCNVIVSDNESPKNRFRRSVIQPVESESTKKSKLAKQAADAAIQKELEFVALRRKANSTVSKIMKDTEIAFNKAFAEALQTRNGVECSNVVYQICRDIKAQDQQRQPVPNEFKNHQPEYLKWLREQASVLLGHGSANNDHIHSNHTTTTTLSSSEFKDLVHHIAKEYNGTAVLAPVKGYKRTVEKVQEKYGGDYSRILDLARGMVVFDTIEQLSGALDYIKSCHDDEATITESCSKEEATTGKKPSLLLVRAKDRLSPAFDASKYTGGYRDILLNLCFSSGHIAELQLHVSSFLDLKNRRGHRVYEEARSIHMFNEAFTERSYNWNNESSEEEIEELLDEILSGAVTKLDLDYSEGLGNPENQTRLAKALLGTECRVQELSLRSCFCGDDFIVKCLPLDDEELWSSENDHGHVGRVIRLGSKLHEGTGGRISEVGVTRMVRYLNTSLRILDLQGCLDLEWYENCGDSVANALLSLANDMEVENVILLPQLQEINLKSTGLTPDGMNTLLQLKHRGHLGHAKILMDSKLRTGPPRCIGRTKS